MGKFGAVVGSSMFKPLIVAPWRFREMNDI